MKNKIHPKNYRIVIFKDINNNKKFKIKSTVITNDTINIKNKKYPLFKVDISSKSHPFYTGKIKFIDSEGRIEKFYKKYKIKL